MPHMTHKSRLKNTAPIRDLNALTVKNFFSSETGNNATSEITTNSLIANKNRMMAN